MAVIGDKREIMRTGIYEFMSALRFDYRQMSRVSFPEPYCCC